VSLPEGDRRAQSRNPFFPQQQILGNKQIRWWWNNAHQALYDDGDGHGDAPKGPATEWIAQSKPVVFTEYGFPACDKCTNQPNVFFDAKSTESATPYWSAWRNADGGGFLPKPDQNLQLLALQAIYEYWFTEGHNAVSSAGIKMIEPAVLLGMELGRAAVPDLPEAFRSLGRCGQLGGGKLAERKRTVSHPAGAGRSVRARALSGVSHARQDRLERPLPPRLHDGHP
jgi:hypothetical protein